MEKIASECASKITQVKDNINSSTQIAGMTLPSLEIQNNKIAVHTALWKIQC